MLSRSYTINSGSNRDYDNLKQQCDKAMSELTLLKRQHSETARRCDHAMKVRFDLSTPIRFIHSDFTIITLFKFLGIGLLSRSTSGSYESTRGICTGFGSVTYKIRGSC